MAVFEIINPSDPVTFEADDPDIAAVAVLMLGSGTMGVVDEEGNDVLPLLAFGGEPAFNAWKAEHPSAVEKATSPEGRLAIAAALDTTAVCSMANRKALLAATNGDPKAIERWNEAKRTSMNNICGAARRYAEALRREQAEAVRS